MSLSKKRIRKLINYSKENRIKRVKRYVKKYKIDLRTELGEDCLRMASIYGSYAIVKYVQFIYTHTHIYIYIKTTCVAQLAKALDTQAVGRGFEPRPDQ